MKNRFLFLLLVFLFFAVSCKVSVNIPKGESINKNVTILPAGTDGSGGTEATYVLYGKWPQSLKDSSVKINTSEKIACGNFEYYLGSDGEYYYLYNDIYYKVEPIKWRVLKKKSNGDWLLFSEYILSASYFYDNTSSRTIDGNTILATNYEHSRVRAFLNGIEYLKDNTMNPEFTNKGFFQTAFSQEEQSKILKTTVDNSADQMKPNGFESSGYIPDNYNNTDDYVFLLSIKEITSEEYGFAPHNASNDNLVLTRSRVRTATDFFMVQCPQITLNDYYYSQEYGFYSYGWWTRSTYNDDYMYYVNHRGDSFYYKPTDIPQSGIAPAIVVKGE